MDAFNEIDNTMSLALSQDLHPMELVIILFHSGKSIHEKSVELKWKHYTPYIKLLIDYISENYELIDRADLEKHLQTEYQKDLSISFTLFLSIMEKYVKEIYQKGIFFFKEKYETSHNSYHERIMNMYYDDYFSLNMKKILQFLVYEKHSDELLPLIESSYPNHFTVEKVQDMMKECKFRRNIASFEEKLKEVHDISDFLNSVVENQIHTVYYHTRQIDEHVESLYSKLNVLSARYTTNENVIQMMNYIQSMEHRIITSVEREISNQREISNYTSEISNDSRSRIELDQLFENAFMSEFNQHMVNINPYFVDMLRQYFNTTKMMMKSKYVLQDLEAIIQNQLHFA